MTAFRGIRVLDCSQGLAGPLAAVLLADFGAEVLKVEPPGGDRAKHLPGYLTWNRNKKRLTLDLSSDEGRERLAPLLVAADVAVFDHSPRDIEALGLDGETLTARYPRLVHLWTPPYGTTGRWSELPAHHATLTGLTGCAFRQGGYSDQPIWHVAQIVHHAQGVLAASAAGAALIQRGAVGRGRAVTVSGLHAMAETACPVSQVGFSGMMRGHPLGGSASYRLYQCGDGQWLFLAALFAPFFQRTLQALNIGYGGDVGYAIQTTLESRPRDHWVALFREWDVPASAVDRREDFLASDVIRANDLVAELPNPELGPVRMVGPPARLCDTPGSVRHLIEDATPGDLAAFTAPRPQTPTLAPVAEPPLRGVRVLDLGTVIAGTYAGAILANFGADVVKVESQDGDPFRYSGAFVNYNRGKRGLGLDLKAPAGQALFLDLARGADVVLDNYRLGVRERLGIDHATLAGVNPRLISCSINTYGSRGPDAALPGFDALLQARSGQMRGQGGGEDDEPVFHAIPINDVATAAMGAFAIIAALHGRERTGLGQNTETSLAAQSALYQSGDLTWFEGRPPLAAGGRDCIGFSALDRFYRCADGWLTLACTTAKQFADLAGALDRPDWTDRWPGDAALAEPRDGPLAAELERAFTALRRDEAADVLCDAGVPAAPVLRGTEVQRDDFFWDNGYFELRSHPGEGELVTSRGFADFDGKPLRFERLDPELGEHGVEVLQDYGVPRERIVELARGHVIFRG